jgi:uncharacterized repeat protein (TIGR03847 family)
VSQPELIELDHADFVTIDTIGPPGQRTFYLQAGQDDTLVSLIIEKEQATAIAVAIENVLSRLGRSEDEPELGGRDLIEPVSPLFRVGQLKLGYDEERDMLVIVAVEWTTESQPRTRVHIWASLAQMAALAHQAAATVSSGRPSCPLCHEMINPGEEHVCDRGNGRKRLYADV